MGGFSDTTFRVGVAACGGVMSDKAGRDCLPL